LKNFQQSGKAWIPFNPEVMHQIRRSEMLGFRDYGIAGILSFLVPKKMDHFKNNLRNLESKNYSANTFSKGTDNYSWLVHWDIPLLHKILTANRRISNIESR